VLKVGIYVPYVKNEVTLAAVQFADWLVRCGLQVEILSNGKVSSGIHSFWDKKVRRCRDSGSVFRWAFSATHLCWFSPDYKAYEAARTVARDTAKKSVRNIFFPDLCRWSESHVGFFQECDRTICLSQDLSRWLDVKHPTIQTSRTWANLVSPSLSLSNKQGLINPDQLRLLIVMDRSMTIDIGIEIISMFRSILEKNNKIHLTFVFSGALPKTYSNVLKLIASEYRGRLKCVGNIGYPDYIHLVLQHDWVYSAVTRYRTGALLSHLLVTNVPIICHDIAPVCGHLSDAITGKLIPCATHDRYFPVAAVELDNIKNEIESVLALTEKQLVVMQLAIANQIRKKQASFEKFIIKEFIS